MAPESCHSLGDPVFCVGRSGAVFAVVAGPLYGGGFEPAGRGGSGDDPVGPTDGAEFAATGGKAPGVPVPGILSNGSVDFERGSLSGSLPTGGGGRLTPVDHLLHVQD